MLGLQRVLGLRLTSLHERRHKRTDGVIKHFLGPAWVVTVVVLVTWSLSMGPWGSPHARKWPRRGYGGWIEPVPKSY